MVHGGVKAAGGSYEFESAEMAGEALKLLGEEFELPDFAKARAVWFKIVKGELVARISREKNDAKQEMRTFGWLEQGNNHWERVYEIDPGQPQSKQTTPQCYDNRVRHLVTPSNENAGWVVCDSKGRWIEEPKNNVKSVMKSWALSDSAAEAALGHLISNPWDVVNLPFQDEFPGDRRWNRNAAQFAFNPTDEDREMHHPHWDRILTHCGRGLDKAVAGDSWCRQHGIRTGSDYLRLWAAILFQRPTHPLPYLFLFSARQNTGKSSLHQALGLLMKSGRGYVEAANALTSQHGYNLSLSGAILCYIEEQDLSRSGSEAYSRIKKWVTGDKLAIHPKYVNEYMMTNTTHWIQCANDRGACPVFAGDSRIVMIEVPQLSNDEIPWESKMKPTLIEEAPDFLRTLLDTVPPEPIGRLWLPVIDTLAKREAIAANDVMEPTAAPNIDDKLVANVREYLAERVYYAIKGDGVSNKRLQFWEGTFTALGKLLGFEDTEPTQLSRALRRVRTQLREKGIEIIFPEHQTGTTGQRLVTIAESWLIEAESYEKVLPTDVESAENCLFELESLLRSQEDEAIVADPENESEISERPTERNP